MQQQEKDAKESRERILQTMYSYLRGAPERSRLLVLSLLVGLCCGLAAVLLHGFIDIVHSLLDRSFTGWASPLRYLVMPGVGMLLSLLIVKYILREDISHGVTKVLQAISKNESRIGTSNTWSSLLTSGLTIGFGGSVGAEAPIVYTGAAIGSFFARRNRLSYRSATILIGCGAAGAVAGIFKAPLAGLLFTLEILLFNISMNAMMPMLLCTVSATLVSYLFLGDSRPFDCNITPFSMANIPFYIVLGVLCGLFSLYFLRMTLRLEDLLGKLRGTYLKWIICAVGLGLLIFLFPPLFGEGYDFLRPLLKGEEIQYAAPGITSGMLSSSWGIPLFFLLVMLLKVFSMTFTNAGGGVGGTFGPTLFVGAIAGFVVARTLNLLLLGSGLSVPEQNFVLVGMGGLMAGVMQAPMTAIFLIAEITGGYELFVPLILTSTLSFGTMRLFEKYSIYTKRIAQRGELLTHDSDHSVLTLLRLGDMLETDFTKVEIDATLGQLVQAISDSTRNIFPVIDSKGHFQGYVALEAVRKDMFRPELYPVRHVYNYMRSFPVYVYEGEGMESVMDKFEKTGAWSLPVVRKEDRYYLGFVSKSKIFSAYRDELKEFSQD